MDTKARARNVRLLVLDVDGVLTRGEILIGPDGEVMKMFNAQDGLGINIAHRGGLKTAVVTGRNSEIVRRRCGELAVGDICQGCRNKTAALRQLADKYRLPFEAIAYVGDDLNDLAAMRQAGFAAATANAVPEIKTAAHFVAARSGGQGAVREIVEFILKAQDKWEGIIAFFTAPGDIDARQ